MRVVLVLIVGAVFCQPIHAGQSVFVSDLDLTKVLQARGSAQKDRSVEGKPLRIAGRKFDRGVGTHAESTLWIHVEGRAQRFLTHIGVDDGAGSGAGSVNFKIVTDEGTIYQSGMMKAGTPARKIDVDIRGTGVLILIVEDGGDGMNRDHANWADAQIFYTGAMPKTVEPPQEEPYLLTPAPGPEPRINGALRVGVRLGRPLLYTMAVTGRRPMTFTAQGLPAGITLDSQTGRLRGRTDAAGSHPVVLTARNTQGEARATLQLVVGDTIALTPPMGWNSWNCWGCAVDESHIRLAAQAMVERGLIHHGWSYINIDDCWMRHPESDDPRVRGPVRDENGMLRPNGKFPDMAGLVRDIHALGLKAGIYISPGPTTCQGYVGSYRFEAQDAVQFAAWGFDYLKYDWCGYSHVDPDPDYAGLVKPYRLMHECLQQVDRDIVYSLCQYGWGNVWEWGATVGGNCWRTTGDIVDTWGRMSGIGFGQHERSPFAMPGQWNDPDMLVLGRVGWGPHLRDSRLTPTEQYTHMSLWCLLSAPLLLGCDLTQLDDFTLNLLTNDEVLAVNQDPLGRQARRIDKQGPQEIWSKAMADGSLAVGLFNRGELPVDVKVTWQQLGLDGPQRTRDLWRQQDLGVFPESYVHSIGRHGVILLRVTSVRGGR